MTKANDTKESSVVSSARLTKWHVPIRWKLFSMTALVGLVAAAIAMSGLSRMQSLNDRMNQIVDVSAAKSKLASLMKQEVVTAIRAERNMVLAKSEEEMNRYVATIDETLAELDENAATLRTIVSDDTRKQLDNFKSIWNQWRANHQELRELTRLNSDVRARELSVGVARQQVDHLNQALTDLAIYREENARAADLIVEIRLAILELQRMEKNLILASGLEAANDFVVQVEPLRAKIRNALEALEAYDDSERTKVTSAKQAFESYVESSEAIRGLMGESGNYMVFHLVYGVGAPLADKSERQLDAIIAGSEAEINKLQASSKQSYETARNGLIVISVVGILTSIVYSLLVGDRFARNLSALATYAREVRNARDLSKPIPYAGNDEVGRVAEALDSMRETVYQQTEQLASLNSALSDKSDEMEQFVYTVSHDLKSPLVSCKGMLGLIREDLADNEYDEVLDSVGRMEAATDQLSQIIDDLLELSRIGRKPLELTRVDVASLVGEVVDSLSERIADAGAELSIADGLPDARADKSDLCRVFDNLISNAIKYACDVDAPRIEIGANQTRYTNRYCVRDNGPGIEPDYQEKVFELFQRLDTDKEGTGLGLASVRKIVRMHGGRVWVESAPGQGATFWIELPRNYE